MNKSGHLKTKNSLLAVKWGDRKHSSFSFGKYWFAIMTSVWLLRLTKSDSYPDIIELANRIQRLVEKSGFNYSVDYLKLANLTMMKAIAGEEFEQPEGGARVAVRRGLPLIIPTKLRFLIEASDVKIIKVVLSLFAQYRVMPASPRAKLSTITHPFTGLVETLPDIGMAIQRWNRKFGDLPSFFSDFNRPKGPWTVGRNLLNISTAGPNTSNQTLGYPLDALALKGKPKMLSIIKEFSLLIGYKDIWEKLDDEIKFLCDDKNSGLILSLTTKIPSNYKDLKHPLIDKEKVYWEEYNKISSLISSLSKEKRELSKQLKPAELKSFNKRISSLLNKRKGLKMKNYTYKELSQIKSYYDSVYPTKLGKLSLKMEPAGKVRIFAIVDAWTQTLLSPVHNALFSMLRKIPQDGTFNQLAPIKVLFDKGHKRFWSFDLSAATDRLPLALQKQILGKLANNDRFATLWGKLLVDRDFSLYSEELPKLNGNYRYAVGQPMGALSSWGSLALTHHLIVQIASLRVGNEGWFEDYAILGDDIVIADEIVAKAYLVLMNQLGVDINLAKSLVSSNGTLEFAKQLFNNGVNLSPLGPKALFELKYEPYNLIDILKDYNLIDCVDPEALKSDLQYLFNTVRVVPSSKWCKRIPAVYWDIVSVFGLNLIQDLSPGLLSQAINSLEEGFKETFNTVLNDVLVSKVTKGWFEAIETSIDVYRKYSSLFRINGMNELPSTQALLNNFSASLAETASHRFTDFDQLPLAERVEIAYSDLSMLTYSLESSDTQRRTIKSLRLSKDLMKILFEQRPDIATKLFVTSRAVA